MFWQLGSLNGSIWDFFIVNMCMIFFGMQLEQEVSTLKNRLDGLRKAKNTTITKREREVVEVGFKR